MTRDEAYRIVQANAQQAWDTQTPLRELLAGEPEPRASTSTRSSTTRASPATSPSCSRGSTRSLRQRGRDERAAAHARRAVRLGGPLPRAPARHRRPVPLRRARRPHASRSPACSSATASRRCGARRSRSIDPFALGLDELLNAGVGFLDGEIEVATCAPAASSASSARSCRPTSRSRGPTGCARRRIELRVDADALRPPPARQDRRPARGHPPRPGRRRRGDGEPRRRCCATPRAGLTCEQVREADAGGLRRARRRAARDGDRRPRRAVGASGHEEGSGPIAARRHRADRHLAARQALALLGRHDAHVRGRRRGAAGGAAASTGSSTRASLDAVMPRLRPGAVCREIYGARRASRSRPRASRRVRTKAQGTDARGGLLPRPRPRGRARGPRAARTSAAPTSALIAGDVVTVEPGCYRPGFGGVPPGGPRARHRGRLRGPHRLPVRALAVAVRGASCAHPQLAGNPPPRQPIPLLASAA